MPEGAGAAKQPNQNVGLIVSVALLAVSPLFFILPFAVGAGPNPGGNTAQQPISFSDPLVTAKLEDLKRLSDPQGFATSSTGLDEYEATLIALRTRLSELGGREAALENIAAQLALVTQLRGSIGNAKASAELVGKLRDLRAKLPSQVGGATGSLIELAIQLGRQSEANPRQSFPYSQQKRNEIFNESLTTRHSDCSSFVSYLLYKTGNTYIRPNSLVPDTSYLLTMAIRKQGLEPVLVQNRLSLEQVREVIRPGDLLLSDVLPGRKGGGAHVVLYIGPGNAEGDIVQSGGGGGGGKINFTSLEERMRGRNTTAILRPTLGVPS